MTIKWDYESTIMELVNLDYQSAVTKVDSFFSELNKEFGNIGGIKVCILVDKSGKEFFSEQRLKFNFLKDALVLNDTGDLDIKYPCLRDNILIIFDDSIKTGKTIQRVLDLTKKAQPKAVYVVAIIGSQQTLKFLKDKYNSTVFKILEEIPGDLDKREFDIRYHNSSSKILDAYIKYTCKPRQDQQVHPYLLVKFNNYLGNFSEILEQFDLIEDNDEGFRFSDRYIRSIFLDQNILDNIINYACFKEIKLPSDWDIFIRVFYRGDLQEVILQPVVRRHANFYIDNPLLLESRDYFIKLAIINYLIEQLLLKLDRKIIENMCIKCNNKIVL